MNNINYLIKKYKINPKKYIIKNNCVIINSDSNSYVFKKNNNRLHDLYNYLNSRNFDFYPEIINNKEEDYNIFKYIKDIKTPKEQKAIDLINILILLHSKTTHYKEIDFEKNKKIYEENYNYLSYIENYYSDIISLIEKEEYMSPSNYLLARNISKVFASIEYCKKELKNWYNLIKNKKKERIVTIHNNLKLEHIINSKKPYLISFDKYIKSSPIYDLLTFYKNHYLEIDFIELFKIYESKYPLLNEEKTLLSILLSLPQKIEFKENEYENCKIIRKNIDYLYKTEEIVNHFLKKT